jgi:tetratricopeptide (TPR) repeat protein
MTSVAAEGEILLSAALIVRDEERFLGGCLASIAGLVDETVVVDTGSTDRSREIAREAGARLAELRWNGDFAAARNYALDLARGAWILYIDADERVSAGGRAEVEPLLRDPRLAACTVRFRPITGYTRYREHRLFRNRPDLRFAGVIHETHVPALLDLCAREGLTIAHSALAIDHLGYDGDLAHKHRRNLPLLRARLAADPCHVYSWCHLGLTLLGLGDEAAAEEAWRQAVGVVRGKRARSLADSGPYVDLARCLLRRGENAAAAGIVDEGLFFFPDNFTLQWLRGRALVDAARFAEALPVFERLAATDPEAAAGGVLAHDERIFGRLAFEGLGLCCFQLGRFAESARWYGRAEEASPAPLENRTKRQLAALLAGR